VWALEPPAELILNSRDSSPGCKRLTTPRQWQEPRQLEGIGGSAWLAPKCRPWVRTLIVTFQKETATVRSGWRYDLGAWPPCGCGCLALPPTKPGRLVCYPKRQHSAHRKKSSSRAPIRLRSNDLARDDVFFRFHSRLREFSQPIDEAIISPQPSNLARSEGGNSFCGPSDVPTAAIFLGNQLGDFQAGGAAKDDIF
jgi:hypothetical protein